jgi:hypothetical protein
MKKILSFIYVFVFTISSAAASLYGEIIETQEIKTLVPFVNQESFVFLNVSSTLYSSSNTLGGQQWREYFFDRIKEVIDDEEVAQQLYDKITTQLTIHIPERSLEEFTPHLITYLQNKNIIILGHTQKRVSTPYANHFGEMIHDHLLSLGIQFERTLTYFPMRKLGQKDFSFIHGILFTNEKPLGSILLSFLKQSVKIPSNIIMVDNSLDSLENVQQALESSGISFVGIRYGRADTLQEQFDPILGIIEFLAFMNEGTILSDEEALNTIPDDKSVDYEALLDQYIEQAILSESNK